jgi:hypothetical protein
MTSEIPKPIHMTKGDTINQPKNMDAGPPATRLDPKFSNLNYK